MTAPLNLLNQRFERLTVIKRAENNRSGGTMWLCKCDCGRTKTIWGKSLTNGNTKSCGCYHRDVISGMNNYQAKRALAEHGMYMPSEDPFYIQAMSLMKRCRDYNIPIGFDSIIEFASYLKEIAPEKCPVFGKKLVRGSGKSHDFSPSVDKIIPSKGYVRGNLQIISYLANSMKRDATPEQLRHFAHWVMRGKHE